MLGRSLLDSISTKNVNKPSDLEFVYYLFFDKGISLKEFNELPIPYILSILKTHNFVTEQERKALEKSQRKK